MIRASLYDAAAGCPARPRGSSVQRLAGIKRPERKFRRLRLYFFQLFYEVAGPRYALLCFATHVEARSPPELVRHRLAVII